MEQEIDDLVDFIKTESIMKYKKIKNNVKYWSKISKSLKNNLR